MHSKCVAKLPSTVAKTKLLVGGHNDMLVYTCVSLGFVKTNTQRRKGSTNHSVLWCVPFLSLSVVYVLIRLFLEFFLVKSVTVVPMVVVHTQLKGVT